MPQKFNYIDFSKEISSLPSKSASLSKDRYISRDFMAMEWDGIWTKTWLFAGIEADISITGIDKSIENFAASTLFKPTILEPV